MRVRAHRVADELPRPARDLPFQRGEDVSCLGSPLGREEGVGKDVQIRQGRRVLQEPAGLRAGRTGSVSVRYFVTAGSLLVASVLARFGAEHPGVGIEFEFTDPGSFAGSGTWPGRSGRGRPGA